MDIAEVVRWERRNRERERRGAVITHVNATWKRALRTGRMPRSWVRFFRTQMEDVYAAREARGDQ